MLSSAFWRGREYIGMHPLRINNVIISRMIQFQMDWKSVALALVVLLLLLQLIVKRQFSECDGGMKPNRSRCVSFTPHMLEMS